MLGAKSVAVPVCEMRSISLMSITVIQQQAANSSASVKRLSTSMCDFDVCTLSPVSFYGQRTSQIWTKLNWINRTELVQFSSVQFGRVRWPLVLISLHISHKLCTHQRSSRALVLTPAFTGRDHRWRSLNPVMWPQPVNKVNVYRAIWSTQLQSIFATAYHKLPVKSVWESHKCFTLWDAFSLCLKGRYSANHRVRFVSTLRVFQRNNVSAQWVHSLHVSDSVSPISDFWNGRHPRLFHQVCGSDTKIWTQWTTKYA